MACANVLRFQCLQTLPNSMCTIHWRSSRREAFLSMSSSQWESDVHPSKEFQKQCFFFLSSKALMRAVISAQIVIYDWCMRYWTSGNSCPSMMRQLSAHPDMKFYDLNFNCRVLSDEVGASRTATLSYPHLCLIYHQNIHSSYRELDAKYSLWTSFRVL